MELPSKEGVFTLSHVGTMTGKKYEGTFTVLCLMSIAQKHLMELEKTQLLGNNKVPTAALLGIAEVLSSLRAKIVDGPEWWKQGLGSDIMDEDVLTVMYEKIQEAEREWHKNLQEKVKALTPPQTA